MQGMLKELAAHQEFASISDDLRDDQSQGAY